MWWCIKYKPSTVSEDWKKIKEQKLQCRSKTLTRRHQREQIDKGTTVSFFRIVLLRSKFNFSIVSCFFERNINISGCRKTIFFFACLSLNSCSSFLFAAWFLQFGIMSWCTIESDPGMLSEWFLVFSHEYMARVVFRVKGIDFDWYIALKFAAFFSPRCIYRTYSANASERCTGIFYWTYDIFFLSLQVVV